MKFENVKVFNIESAVHGIRNAKKSWDKSDSSGDYIGDEDLELAKKLIKAGSSHRKFLRQIMVSVDITAPMYWWAEFDTYKVGVTRNSTSFMHSAMDKPFALDDFGFDINAENLHKLSLSDIKFFLEKSNFSIFQTVIERLNEFRNLYLETKDMRYFRAIRQLVPSAYNYLSSVTMNYEVLRNMFQQRKNHKLTEWSIDFAEFCRKLPYSSFIMEDN